MAVETLERTTAPAEGARKRSPRVVLQTFFGFTWYLGSLYLGAGTIHWTRGWICVALWVTAMPAVGLIAHHYNPGLLRERAKWRRKDTKRFDKVFFALYMPLALFQPALGAIDVVRYHWSSLPFAYVYVGVILYLLASSIVAWVLATNPYAESSVRIQTDRGQTVITSGPYRFVRHPMYVGCILMYFGTPLILGSLWAVMAAAVVAVLFLARTVLEDRALRRELPGYGEYAARTRYRLLPGVW